MAEKEEITFTIGPDGSVQFEVKGVKGGACLDITKELEEELGVVTSQEKTSEFYEEEVEEVTKKYALVTDDG